MSQLKKQLNKLVNMNKKLKTISTTEKLLKTTKHYLANAKLAAFNLILQQKISNNVKQKSLKLIESMDRPLRK